MARDFWRSQLVCTGQEWIVFLVLIGDEDSKNSLSLNLDSSLKFRECCQSSLLYCCVICSWFLTILHMKKAKLQGHGWTLWGWESNTCLELHAIVISTVPHIFTHRLKKRSLYIGVRYIMVNLAIGACCSGKNSRPSDRPFLPLATPWWSLRPFLPWSLSSSKYICDLHCLHLYIENHYQECNFFHCFLIF